MQGSIISGMLKKQGDLMSQAENLGVAHRPAVRQEPGGGDKVRCPATQTLVELRERKIYDDKEIEKINI